MKYLLTLVFVFFLSACDSKIGASSASSIDGTYTSVDGRNNFTFTSSGKVRVAFFGNPKETTYTLQDNAIKFHFEGGMPQTFVLNPDGSLTSDTATKYKKN
jgi:hypothetical protein